MAALTQARMTRETRAKHMSLPLAAGQKVWQGGIACWDTSTGTVKKGAASTTLVKIGQFDDSIDNSAGTGSVFINVNLDRELVAQWYDNATGANAVAAANQGSDVYIQDDHTVTTASAGNSKAGRVWAVDTVKGVLVQNDQSIS